MALYAIAMANVEAAVVVYLRELHGIDDLIRDLPTVADRLVALEIGREAATVAMLLAVGWLAGRRLQDRLGHFVFAFGLWDIAYYGWLALYEGWPRPPLDWDVLFLIPVPWWGPVLAPALIAAVMCLGGAAAVRQVDRGVAWRLTWTNVAIAAAGSAIVLYTFTAENLPDNNAMMPTIPFVLYGLLRYLYLVHQRKEGGSPEEVLLRDWPLILDILLWLATASTVLVVFRE